MTKQLGLSRPLLSFNAVDQSYPVKSLCNVLLAGIWVAWLCWPDGSAANPIVVREHEAFSRNVQPVSGVAALVCGAALVAESICVALLSGRRNAASMFLWFTVTLATFLVFIVWPTGDWAPIGPSGPRIAQSLAAEALVVCVEGVVLWRMWFRAVPKGAARAFGIALLGNLLSLAIGGLYALMA
jgi:drug/metabolite transporter (DMT)-like permease